MFGHRANVHEGWKAVSRHKSGVPYEHDVWELYHLDSDFSECRDRARDEPERLQRMIALWWQEAERHGVLPLDDRGSAEMFRASRRPNMPTSRNRFEYFPPIAHISADSCHSAARSFVLDVDLVHPAQGGDGALVARGTINSGYVLCVQDGRLCFDYNCFHSHSVTRAEAPLAPGAHRVTLRFTRAEAGARVELLVDGTRVAEGAIPRTLFVISSVGIDIGRSLSPVNERYQAPFAYPGRIDRVGVEVEAKASMGEVKSQMRTEMIRQ